MRSAINLIPPALVTGRLWRARGELLGITALITGLACGGLWLILQQQASTAEELANRAKNNATAPKQVLSTAEVADTLARVSALNTIALTEINWPSALADVGKLLPKDIRLSTYSYALGPTGITLQMAGLAKTAATFAAFASTMQTDSRFKAVTVDSYTYTPSTGMVSFTMTVLRLSTQLTYTPSR